MGGFYLDIIKDRIYTCAENSLPRRSAQTALHHIAEAFTRWIAPILSFTADEIWGFMPGERESSVFIGRVVPAAASRLSGDTISQPLTGLRLLQAKEAINKVIEDQRNQGVVKGSLGADIELFAAPELHQSLAKLGDELRFVTITSKATLLASGAGRRANGSMLEGLQVSLQRSSAEKCVRCWHFIDDVGSHAEHPEICGRCVTNLSEWVRPATMPETSSKAKNSALAKVVCPGGNRTAAGSADQAVDYGEFSLGRASMSMASLIWCGLTMRAPPLAFSAMPVAGSAGCSAGISIVVS